MSDSVDLTGKRPDTQLSQVSVSSTIPASPADHAPQYAVLQEQLAEASLLVDDIVLKNYLTSLTDFEVIPLDASLKQISDIRFFKISEMVYQSNEYSTYKFASVFNSLQNLNCGIFIIADSNGEKTEFYMGVRSFDGRRTTKSLKDTLRNALCGQFPGVKTKDLLDPEAESFLANIEAKNIAAVSCVANNKDDEFNDNEKFIQGLEKLSLAMQGQRYTVVILAKSTSQEQLADTRRAYEQIYTQLSPFANMQMSYGRNQAVNISEAFSKGTTHGTSHSTNISTQTGRSHTSNVSTNHSESKRDWKAMALKAGGSALLGIASLVAAPLTGGASLAAAGAIMAGQVGLNMIDPKTTSDGTTEGSSDTDTSAETVGSTDTVNDGTSENYTHTSGSTTGTSENLQLTMQNKTLIDMLDRIDKQLKRIDECESLGMWECAAYFMSDSQETVEMAAGTYKAIMRGERSGIETSAVNFWGRGSSDKLPALREYITNFVHPVFSYRSEHSAIPVTAASLVSGNELAIQMGLPRKSVCGFPVIEHADFGKEIVYAGTHRNDKFPIGNIFSMGQRTLTEARLSRDSLTMHTFVTGSTGSGKSNTVYEMINQLRAIYNVPFLVVEPAKGEYKNVFGQFPDVRVYGTNPKKFSALLRLNPFRFPADIHILEHLDRLVEIFNVCWPMYAAMPAVLKDAMEKAYTALGWDLANSENPKGNVYPNFADVLEQIENVIDNSRYSADTKGDYAGALCTRVRSLTNGLNGLIFCSDDLPDNALFDQNVIVDLSRIGSIETKSLIMGLLVMKLNEYRMTSGKINNSLSHITVLEEAHNLLKRTSTEQSAESSNLLGKSVELLANSIAEMRTYGEGFIIADQSPGLLDMYVIRNTNTKIILRLPEQSDRELVGLSAGLNRDQIQELSKLECGVAAVYQNDWVEPVLIQINKCGIHEAMYEAANSAQMADTGKVKMQLIYFLLQGRISKPLEFDVSVIERHLSALNISTRYLEFIEEQIGEYRDEGILDLWSDDNFKRLSRWLTGLLDIRSQVERCVITARSNGELTEKLESIIREAVPGIDEDVILTLCHCSLRDMSTVPGCAEARERIYRSWYEATVEGGKGR